MMNTQVLNYLVSIDELLTMFIKVTSARLERLEKAAGLEIAPQLSETVRDLIARQETLHDQFHAAIEGVQKKLPKSPTPLPPE